MRPTRFPVLLALAFALAAAGCGGDEAETDVPPVDTAAVTDAPLPEEPGLASDTASFVTRGDGPAALRGTLWVAGAQPSDWEGVSFVAQLEGVTPPRSYGWAIHQGDCDAPDDLLLPLGWGTEAAEGRWQTGGPLGEMRPAFQPSTGGTVAETVFIPLDGDLSRQRLLDTPHSLRIHPDPGDDVVHPSVACAPIPSLPERAGP